MAGEPPSLLSPSHPNSPHRERNDEDEDVPVLVAIGPDGLYDEGVGDALRAWAENHSDRVAVLDLRGQAPDGASAEQWAISFQRALDES